MKRCVIAPAGPHEADALARLHKACFPHRPWSRAEFEGFFERGGIVAYLARDDHKETGFSFCHAVAGQCEILALGVLKAARGQGVARNLLAESLAQAKSMGAQEAYLEVQVDNKAAIGLYESAGFAITGRRKKYYIIPGQGAEDALTMARKL